MTRGEKPAFVQNDVNPHTISGDGFRFNNTQSSLANFSNLIFGVVCDDGRGQAKQFI